MSQLCKTGHCGTFGGLLRTRPSRFSFNMQQAWLVSRGGRERSRGIPRPEKIFSLTYTVHTTNMLPLAICAAVERAVDQMKAGEVR